MDDSRKTKAQLLEELAALRARVSQLESRGGGPGGESAVARALAANCRKSLELYRRSVFVVDRDLRIHYANAHCREWFAELGGRGELAGRLLTEAFVFADVGPADQYRRALDDGESLFREYRFQIAGCDNYCELRCVPLFDGGRTALALTIVRDLTQTTLLRQTRQAEAEMARVLTVASSLDEAVSGCIEVSRSIAAALDFGGTYRLVEATGALELMAQYGLSPAETDRLRRFDAGTANARLALAGRAAHFDVERMAEQGSGMAFPEGARCCTWIPIVSEGRPIAVVFAGSRTLEEIAPRVQEALESIATLVGSTIARLQTIEALRASEGSYRAIFDGVSDALLIRDPETAEILEMNRAAVELYGYTCEEMRRFARPSTVDEPPYTMAEAFRLFRQAASGEPQRFEWPAQHKNGARFWVEVSLRRAMIGGQPRMLCVVRDITQKKQAREELLEARNLLETRVAQRTTELTGANERLQGEIARRARIEGELRESEERFRLLVDSAFEGVAIHRDGIHLDVSKSFAHMFGYEPHEMIGRPASDYVAPGELDKLRERLRVAPDTPIEYLCKRKDGSLFPVEVRSKTLRYQGQDARFVSVRDITERERAEKALRDSEERFRRLSEAGYEGVLIHDHGVLLDVNNRMAELLGREPVEIIGKRILDFVAPEDQERIEAKLRSYNDAPIEFSFLRKDGSAVLVEGRARYFPYEGRYVRVGAVREIAERRQAEEALREREQELEHAHRLAALGQLAAGVAHELNQPLSAILNYAGNCELLLEREGARELFAENLQQIKQQVRRTVDIVAQVRQLAGKQSETAEALDIDSLVEDVVGFCRERMRLESIEVEVDLAAAPLRVWGQRVALEQVLNNLITNAEKAMRGAPTRRLTIWTTRGADGRQVRIFVADTGVGLSDEQKLRIFDPFYTTSQAGEGMGLGLTICHRIVTNMGGSIVAEGTPGKGAVFAVTLPGIVVEQ